MAAIGYFFNAFAVDATDNTPIPATGSSGNPITYPYGYGSNYQLDLLTNPEALPIGRTTMNQLFLDITSQLQQYSRYGTPLFITTDQNQGTPFAYPQYARTYYEGVVYENQVEDNMATPGMDSSWLPISGDSTGVLPGTIIEYAGFSPPAGYLSCDGSAVSRTDYATLMSVITQTQTGTTTNTAFTVSGLTSTAQLTVGVTLECANFPAGTQIASIVDSTSITTNQAATASGSVSIQFFNWGNGDGSTTFNVPLKSGSGSAGQGGFLCTNARPLPDVVGQSTGAATYTLQANDLPPNTHPQQANSTIGTVSGGVFTIGPTGSAGGTTQVNSTANNPISLVQPTIITYALIKT